jgi:flagellar biosynthetic protein FlhB
MPDESFQDRTEQATPKRRQEAREKGTVYKSLEVNSIAILLVSFTLFHFIGAGMISRIGEMMRSYFRRATPAFGESLTADLLTKHVVEIMLALGSILMPLAAALLLTGLAVNVAQVGLVFSGNNVFPKADRLNPLTGLRRMFSFQSVVEALKGLVKILIVAWVLYVTVQGNLPEVIAIIENQPAGIWACLGKLAFQMSLKITLVLAALAAFDYAFQRWQFEKNLRMTKQELKEELKQTEGNPQIKSRIRSMQREAARKRMLTKVPEADVVITNPTTLAIALKYDQKTMEVPVVVAKGARLIAEKIRRIAEEHGIPIIEDKPLAQALYKVVEVGSEIPYQFYKAIAEILAYVYRLKRKTSTG